MSVRPEITRLPRFDARFLYKRTPANIINNSTRCEVVLTNVQIGLDNLGLYKAVDANILGDTILRPVTVLFYYKTKGIPRRNAEKLKALVKKVPTNDALWDVPMWTSCTCEWSIYETNYVLNKARNAPQYHNGQAPLHNRLRGYPTFCKHLHALIPSAIRRKTARSSKPITQRHLKRKATRYKQDFFSTRTR